MPSTPRSLKDVFNGWDGCQASIVGAVTPLTREQLAWRPAPHLRSVGELASHIAFGRVDWFLRMDAPGSRAVAAQIDARPEAAHGDRDAVESAIGRTGQAAELVHWLQTTWQMIDQTLLTWTVDDLWRTYRHTWRGDTYAVSYQWTLWRIMAHDIHHGGELTLMLGMQVLRNFELGDLGGHITLPPLADQL